MQFGNYYLDIEAVLPWIQKAGMAAAILIVTWILSKVVQWAFSNLINRISVLQRTSGSGDSVGKALGKIVGLLIWLMGLIAVLQVFDLSGVIQPLQTLANTTFEMLPRIIGGGVVLFVGTIIGRIVSQITETALAAANLDGWAAKAGLGEVVDGGGSSIGKSIASVLGAIVLILFGIAALQILGISSITDPVVAVLRTILATIPKLLGAAILLAIAFAIARWVSRLIEQVLPATGFDTSVRSLGFVPESTNPSRVVGLIVLTAIMLVTAVEAARMLEFAALSAMITAVVDLGGRVLFGSVVIGVGIGLARLISGLLASSTGGSGFGPTIVNYAVIALFVAMGLNYMGIADTIVQLAFGAIILSAAVASALAFGLGGRSAAQKLLEDWQSAQKATPKAPPAPKAAAPAAKTPVKAAAKAPAKVAAKKPATK